MNTDIKPALCCANCADWRPPLSGNSHGLCRGRGDFVGTLRPGPTHCCVEFRLRTVDYVPAPAGAS